MSEFANHPFEDLPLVIEGDSKEIRYAGDGEVLIRLKPTIYSYTFNRAAEIPGSEVLRLRSAGLLAEVLKAGGVEHSYLGVEDGLIRSELLANNDATWLPDTDFAHKAPPIEVVVKKAHVGMPKHRYFGMQNVAVRAGHEHAGAVIAADQDYPELLVRFDWRNPLHDPDGNRLADEPMSEEMADWFIDVDRARQTALKAFDILDKFLRSKGLELVDICFMIAEEGDMIFSEVSQDCMRVRSSEGSLDKDIWRHGGSSELVLAKWERFNELIGAT